MESWKERAACLDMDVVLFFPEAGRNSWRQVARAKRICAPCPVKAECLEYALRFPDRAIPGIWGGTTEGERRRILDERTYRPDYSPRTNEG